MNDVGVYIADNNQFSNRNPNKPNSYLFTVNYLKVRFSQFSNRNMLFKLNSKLNKKLEDNSLLKGYNPNDSWDYLYSEDSILNNNNNNNDSNTEIYIYTDEIAE